MQLRLKNILPVLTVVAALLASGCIFSPDRKPPKVKVPTTYNSPDSPQNVLENLVNAYNNRDSIETAAVYDSLYVGTTSDPSLPEALPAFSRADEVHHVKRLHDDANIVSVSLDLGQKETWQVNPPNAGDPVDWLVIPLQYQYVRIEDVSNSTTYESARSTVEYTFKPKTTNSGSTVWTVVRWEERAQ